MTLLSVQHVTKKYNKGPVVNDVTFSCEHGTCIALIGPNGAGKTTTLRMLGGLLKPTNGKIKLHSGNRINDFRAYIGYLPQYPTFYNWMTGREFLV